MQEKRTKPGEKAKHVLNEKTTYRFGNRSFIVEPVFKEETQKISNHIKSNLLNNKKNMQRNQFVLLLSDTRT